MAAASRTSGRGRRRIAGDRAQGRNTEFYGWVAAESTVVKLLRRHLIGERGVDRGAINFMAYWAKKRAH
ncbi:SIP domain-containing protein [Pantoea ananatis]